MRDKEAGQGETLSLGNGIKPAARREVIHLDRPLCLFRRAIFSIRGFAVKRFASPTTRGSASASAASSVRTGAVSSSRGRHLARKRPVSHTTRALKVSVLVFASLRQFQLDACAVQFLIVQILYRVFSISPVIKFNKREFGFY